MADEVNAGGNPGAEGAAPTGDVAASVASAPTGEGTPPAGGAAITSPAGDAPAKTDEPKADAKADDKPADSKADEPIDYGKALSEVKLPEGMKLDEAVVKTASDIFGKFGLSPEAAKELTSFYVSQQQAAAEQNVKAWTALQEQWKTEATADKAITPELKAEAKNVFGVFSKESRELLEGYGLTNFGPLIKDLAKFNEYVSDDRFVRGGASAARNGDARTLFPNSNMNP